MTAKQLDDKTSLAVGATKADELQRRLDACDGRDYGHYERQIAVDAIAELRRLQAWTHILANERDEMLRRLASPQETPAGWRLYAERDVIALGNYYLRHLNAMTAEGLHAKSDIAAELAWRDWRYDCATDALRRGPVPEDAPPKEKE